MHRCLEIVELLELICKAADKMPLQNSVRALQLTCRMFFIPASRVLWNVLPSLVPLLLTMPADLLAVAESPDVEKYVRAITFRRNVLDSDWERFDFYAQFVRESSSTASP
ncbi:hypothetical protein BDN70DRAFT_164961 [Pholiota conissans]|uniref:Uncharacterized protein n=1 Tax=Pholiota conissans TaxID=109636 RepID=A0A9P5ZCT1_9AGAR|nr:hypothetical protein BDN70DRAFT_164961 [Pholiota conissans]